MFAKQTRVLAAGEDIRLVPFARRERCPVRPGGRTLRVCASPHRHINPLAHFFFDGVGAKKKLSKRNAVDISPSAEGEEGSAPSTAQTFEKV